MNKFLFSMFAVVAGLAALAEPCVLEKGYKPPAKQADDEVVSLLGELSPDKAAEPQAEPVAPQAEPSQAATPEPQAAETAAGKMPAPPVTAAPSVTAADTPVTETVTGKAGILPAVVPTDSPATNAESQVEKPLPKKPKEKKLTGRPAKITSDTTVYNRKEGIASFEGHVHVDDEQYQIRCTPTACFSSSTSMLTRRMACATQKALTTSIVLQRVLTTLAALRAMSAELWRSVMSR